MKQFILVLVCAVVIPVAFAWVTRKHSLRGFRTAALAFATVGGIVSGLLSIVFLGVFAESVAAYGDNPGAIAGAAIGYLLGIPLVLGMLILIDRFVK